jgi:hypothetical protein
MRKSKDSSANKSPGGEFDRRNFLKSTMGGVAAAICSPLPAEAQSLAQKHLPSTRKTARTF